MKIFFALLFIAFAPLTYGQDYSKLSRSLRTTLRAYTNEMALHSRPAEGVATARTKKILLLVKGDESAIQGRCLSHKGDGRDMIHIVAATMDDVSAMSSDRRIQRMERESHMAQLTNDRSATVTGAETSWQGGEGLPQGFDGTNVIVGVQDAGMQYDHPTFRSKKDNRLRIQRVWDWLDIPEGQVFDIEGDLPLGTFMKNADMIVEKRYSVDSKIMSHGTHTGGTAAGSGYGTSYSGMAPEADIYLVNTVFSDNEEILSEDFRNIVNDNYNILQLIGYEKIFAYADTVGKPCVINFSAGSFGDITDADVLTNEYIKLITGPGKIFVASAGNNGTQRSYLHKDVDTPSCGGIIKNIPDDEAYLAVASNEPCIMRITNHTNGTSRDIFLDFKAGNKEETSPSGLKWYDFTEIEAAEFGDMCISIYSGNDGTREGYVGYDITLSSPNEDFKKNVYSVSLHNISGNYAAEAVMYLLNGSLLDGANYDISLTGGELGGSCFSPGQLDGVIGVGATAWRKEITNIKGSRFVSPYYVRDGEITAYSARGPAVSGITKPDVTAPGDYIVSACNTLYMKQFEELTTVIEKSQYADTDYYWFLNSGTSMSTPVVTGIIALWLQADPTLTPDGIKEVIRNTSRHIDNNMSYPNNIYGWGEIDAYRGLLYILNMTGIKGLDEHHVTDATIRPVNDGIKISLSDSDKALTVRLYTTGGNCIGQYTIPANTQEITIPVSHHGIIAVQIDGKGSTLVRV